MGDRLKHAWNVFLNRDPTVQFPYSEKGQSSSDKPDRTRLRYSNERSIIAAVYNRIAIDVSSMSFQHVRLDQNGRYLETIQSGLNDCLMANANLDQTGRGLLQDITISMFDEGCIAVVPVDTTINPILSGGYDIQSLRVAKIIEWFPSFVRVQIYNERSGRREEVTLPKNTVAIIENPLYTVMNEPNSTLKRLIRKLNLLDAVDEQSSSGKLDIIIQLPYVIKTAARKEQAEIRRQDIETQLKDSKYGIAYSDATEKITQLNRPAENNLMAQIPYLTSTLYSQLGLTEAVFNGTADEKTMINYYNRTIEPISSAIIDEMKRKFLTKTARSQLQSIMFFRDPFKLVPVTDIAEIADKFTRNEILTSNEFRAVIGYKPSDDPKADELRNKNLNPSEQIIPKQKPLVEKRKEILRMMFDFSGYATKNDLKCSDGRTIRKDAFKNNDGQKVPLVWQHLHNDPTNVLGHAILENRDDGVYAFCKFNDSPGGVQAKELVMHGDVCALSIYANQLIQKGKDVIHGAIREVSLVLTGANPGALIESLAIEHTDGSETVDDSEAIIYNDEKLSFTNLEHSEEVEETLEEVFNTLNEKQKTVVYAMIAHALGEDGEIEVKPEDKDFQHSDKGGRKIVKKNIFDKDLQVKEERKTNTLTHAQFQTILDDAKSGSGSLKDAIIAHAVEYGIENIDYLFPDARTLAKDPEWLKREDDWVQGVLAAINHSPFSRVKSVFADMDIDTARAKGYVKATEKKEVYFKAAKRTTTPATVYVKQKLDRDDILDVVDFDVVAMIRFQLRTLLDEELAMAALFGDGREPEDQYKIPEDKIRPIWTDDDLYTVKTKLTTNSEYDLMVKEMALAHKDYKGSGSPVLYTTPDIHTNMLWIEDALGRRIYESDATLCAALRVSAIVEIPQIAELAARVLPDNSERQLLGIKVNLRDYNFGADKGGQVATFDDFDIDFNQYKYLMEARCSGALTKAHAAQIFEYETVAAH